MMDATVVLIFKYLFIDTYLSTDWTNLWAMTLTQINQRVKNKIIMKLKISNAHSPKMAMAINKHLRIQIQGRDSVMTCFQDATWPEHRKYKNSWNFILLHSKIRPKTIYVRGKNMKYRSAGVKLFVLRRFQGCWLVTEALIAAAHIRSDLHYILNLKRHSVTNGLLLSSFSSSWENHL